MAKGALWIGIGIVMIIFDLTVTPVFSIPIAYGWRFPIAALAILYGILAIVSARIAIHHAALSHEEIAQWGQKLEQATPRIIELSEKKWSSEAIAEAVEEESAIPQDILVKYLYAMRGYLKEAAAEAEAEERRAL